MHSTTSPPDKFSKFIGTDAFFSTFDKVAIPRSSPTATNYDTLLTDLSFLQRYLGMLQSIVLVGSAAYGTRSAGSDIDVVLVTKDYSFEIFCEHLFEKEIDTALAGRHTCKIEYTVLSESQVETLFSISSPFSYSIRHGLPLFDTGYLRRIVKSPFPASPPRKYYLKIFSENIVSQYFSALKKSEEEIRKMGCSDACCHAPGNCSGLTSVAVLPHLITKMLYLTLPARGLMPLTKNDAVDFAETFYRHDITDGVKQAVAFIRNKKRRVFFTDYRLLKKTAIRLFGEILTVLGRQQDVEDVIKDAAHIVRGKYQLVANAALRNCLV